MLCEELPPGVELFAGSISPDLPYHSVTVVGEWVGMNENLENLELRKGMEPGMGMGMGTRGALGLKEGDGEVVGWRGGGGKVVGLE